MKNIFNEQMEMSRNKTMFGMSSTQDHSKGFGEKKRGNKIREREKEIHRSTYISCSYRGDLEVVVILVAYSYFNNNLL